jgi:hypothetical protein
LSPERVDSVLTLASRLLKTSAVDSG